MALDAGGSSPGGSFPTSRGHPTEPVRIRRRPRAKLRADRYEELEFLVAEAGITKERARELIKRYGNHRETLLEHVKKLI